MNDGIKEAFKSLKNLLKEDLNKLRYEIQLVNSNLLKETQDDESVNLLKMLLIPRENDEDLNIDHSFGIFWGFDVEITEDERKLTNAEFRKTVYDKVKKAVLTILPTIKNKFNKTILGDIISTYILSPSQNLQNRGKR